MASNLRTESGRGWGHSLLDTYVLHYKAEPVGGALPHQVGHDQSRGAAPAGTAVDQSPPGSVPVDPFSHPVEVVRKGGMWLVLDRDRQDLQAIQLRVGHALQPAGVDNERDVPAGEDAAVQSRIQTAQVQTGTHLRN